MSLLDSLSMYSSIITAICNAPQEPYVYIYCYSYS